MSRPALRARNNAFEGLYLDDFIIGATERGEVVLNADTTTTFITNPAGVTGIQIGEYQLEIRGGEEYGVPNLPDAQEIRPSPWSMPSAPMKG